MRERVVNAAMVTREMRGRAAATYLEEDTVARLEELRRRRALSQEELAMRSGVSSRTIYNIERAQKTEGKPYAPRGKVLRAIAAALEVKPEDVDEFRASLGLPPDDQAQEGA